jgi:hypothetical protein
MARPSKALFAIGVHFVWQKKKKDSPTILARIAKGNLSATSTTVPLKRPPSCAKMMSQLT